MNLRFFDFEVTPNWWLCVFGDLSADLNLTEDIKNTFFSVNSDMPNAREILLNFMRNDVVNIGYNVKRYDLIIANGIYQGFTPQQIKILNDVIINPAKAFETKEHMRIAPFTKKKLSGVVYQDLMDDGSGSLKEKEAIIGLDIRESTVDFNKEDLTQADKDDLEFYCKHDVYSSMVFYKEIVHPYTCTKLSISKHFGIDERICRASTNAKLASLVLGAKRCTFSDSNIIEIEIPNKIKQYCYDNLPTDTLEIIRTSDKGFKTIIFNNEISFGNGGIHSTLAPNLYAESTDDWVLINVDATSYYPSMLIQFNCLSRAVESPEKYVTIFDERVAIKHKKNKTEDDEDAQRARKLVLNTTFGASGNKWLDLYDPHQCTRTCRLGQLFLAALANKIYKTINRVKIIQTNTDGILLYCKRVDIPYLQQLTDEWTKVSGINMEYDYVKKIWQKDVNNYLLIDEFDHIKRKGAWLIDTYKKPGYVMVGALSGFVSAKAVTNYLINGDDIVKSIVNNKNIYDYAITCQKGPTFRGVIQRFADGTEKDLFKCNRVIASKDTNLGKIYKIKMLKGKLSYNSMPSIPDNCRLINEALDSYNFDDFRNDIDYMYYISKAADLLDIPWIKIKNLEMNLTNEFNYFN